MVKTQGQQLLAKEEEILCVIARSLEEAQNVDALIHLRTTEARIQGPIEQLPTSANSLRADS